VTEGLLNFGRPSVSASGSVGDRPQPGSRPATTGEHHDWLNSRRYALRMLLAVEVRS
jgi:hypothetical protein